MLVFLIKELRCIKKITLNQLKNQTGLSISYLSEIENNKVKNPSLISIVKIAKALDLNLDELYFVDSEIEELKRALDIYVEAYGIKDERTIKFSQFINEEINKLKNWKIEKLNNILIIILFKVN